MTDFQTETDALLHFGAQLPADTVLAWRQQVKSRGFKKFEVLERFARWWLDLDKPSQQAFMDEKPMRRIPVLPIFPEERAVLMSDADAVRLIDMLLATRPRLVLDSFERLFADKTSPPAGKAHRRRPSRAGGRSRTIG